MGALKARAACTSRKAFDVNAMFYFATWPAPLFRTWVATEDALALITLIRATAAALIFSVFYCVVLTCLRASYLVFSWVVTSVATMAAS